MTDVVSADSSIPYERPPLSKTFLAGKDTETGILICADDFYSEHGIEIRLNSERWRGPRPKTCSSAVGRGDRIRETRGGDRRSSEDAGHPRRRS